MGRKNTQYLVFFGIKVEKARFFGREGMGLGLKIPRIIGSNYKFDPAEVVGCPETDPPRRTGDRFCGSSLREAPRSDETVWLIKVETMTGAGWRLEVPSPAPMSWSLSTKPKFNLMSDVRCRVSDVASRLRLLPAGRALSTEDRRVGPPSIADTSLV